jgi:hypothetical protein
VLATRYTMAGLGILACLAAALGVNTITSAELSGQTVDWTTNQPVLKQATTFISTPQFSNDNCQKTSVKVVRGVNAAFEDRCFVDSPLGLFDSGGNVIQPLGYTSAYRLAIQGGNSTILPVPNHNAALRVMGYSAGPGVLLGLYNDFPKHVKFTSLSNDAYYSLSGNDLIADSTMRYPGGELLRFNPGALAFSSNGDYLVVDTIWSGVVRINMRDYTIQAFEKSLPRTSGDVPLPGYASISDDGRTAAVAYNAPDNWGDKYFKVYDVSSCTSPFPSSSSLKIQPNCKSFDVLNKLKQVLPTVDFVGNVRFANNHTITFTARYKNDAGQDRYAVYSMTAAGWLASTKQYLALGDSYISGEGALSYREGTDTAINQCHQSLVSYPNLLGIQQASFASVACSGAKVHNVTKPTPKNQNIYQVKGDPTEGVQELAKQSYMPGYILQREFVSANNPEAVTISIGGNDVGFGRILEKCVHPTKHLQDNIETASTCYDNYEDRAEVVQLINSQFTKLKELYRSLREGPSGPRRVYVVGYPQVAKVGGDCGLNVLMNAEEVKFAHDLTEYLDSVIKRAADEAGVQYLDTQHAFDGYRLCEAPVGQAAVNGFTISETPTGQHSFSASYHPNQRGHQLLADTIRAQTDNLSRPMPDPTPQTNEITLDPNLPVLQNIPKTSRPLRYVKFVDRLSTNILKVGSPLNMVFDSEDSYIKPGGVYNLVINSQPVNLGNFTADNTGKLSVSSAIPAGMPIGFHTLHLYGNDMFGNPIDLQQVIFVAASDDDQDGDGVTDSSDSCIYAAQSGTDSDQDSTDDVCDSLIAALPISDPNQPPEGIVWLDNAIMPITIQATSGP